MKFRKKPVVIEAEQWFENGDHSEDDVYRPFEDTGKIPDEPREGKIVRYFRLPDTDKQICEVCGRYLHGHGFIDTLEGGHRVCPGDWIIKGVHGEFYSIKNDIFLETYEKVEEPK